MSFFEKHNQVKTPCAVVLDLDGTITTKDHTSLWWIVDKFALQEPLKQEMEALRGSNDVLAAKGLLSEEAAQKWLLDGCRLLCKHGFRIRDAVGAIRAHAKIRPKVKEFLAALKEANIPVAIISFGCANFIRILLDIHGLHDFVNAVYGVEFYIDRLGKIVGFDKDSLVHPNNKGSWSTSFARKHGVPRRNIIAIGDSCGDRELGYDRDNRLIIAKDEEEEGRLREVFPFVVVTEDYSLVAAWTKTKLSFIRAESEC